MIFAIDENGDIELDKENKTFTNSVNGSITESYFKTARTILVTYLIHGDFFKENFIKNLRNISSDEEISEFLANELNTIFEDDLDVLNYVDYFFINSEDVFTIFFFFEKGEFKKQLINFDVIQ